MVSTLGSVGHSSVWHFDKAWQSEKRGKERGREVVGGSSGREEEGPSQALEGGWAMLHVCFDRQSGAHTKGSKVEQIII